MNIAIDMQAFVSESQNRGVGAYVSGLLDALFAMDKDNEYFLFNLYGPSEVDYIDLPDHVHYERFYMGNKNFLLQYKDGDGTFRIKYAPVIEGIIQSFIKKNAIDLFFLPAPYDRQICFSRKWFDGVRLCAVVYDFIPYVFRDNYLTDPAMETYYDTVNDCLRSADFLFAISNCTKEDAVRFLGVDPEKVRVINAGMSDKYRKKEYTDAQKQEVFGKYGIKGKFMLFPSGDDYRKNTPRTVQAYTRLPQKLRDDVQLVITGSAGDAYIKNIKRICNEAGIAPGRVVIAGHVPFEDLLFLYNTADFILFPTLYEGLGYPVLEAFRCGKPVVTSENSSLGEIAQGAAILVDPFSEADIARGIEQALLAPDFTEISKAAEERLQLFTWEKTAKAVLDTFDSIAKEGRAKPAMARKKLAYFSPIPPQRSGIADYSRDILSELLTYCDIDIFVGDGLEGAAGDIPGAGIYHHSAYPLKRGEYDETLYQMGNSEYHTYMIPYIQKYPGVVVLHDLNLHNSIYHAYGLALPVYNLPGPDWETYAAYLGMEVAYAPEMLERIKSDMHYAHDMASAIVMNRFVTDYAKKIIVHSDYARQALLEKNIGYPVKKIPQYAKAENSQEKGVLRRKYGIPDETLMLSSFGFAVSTKRVYSILRAVKELKNMYPDLKYYIVGELLDAETKDYIRDNGLQNDVVITGFVKDTGCLADYIQMADICLNLRYPYNGETSAILMRILAAGQPVVVSDIGSFSEFPDDCCVKITYDAAKEVSAIVNAVKRLVQDGPYAKGIASNAKKYARENLSLPMIARAYYEYIFDGHPAYLHEQDIRNMCMEVCGKKDVQVMKEFERLSFTLAYLIGEDVRGLPQLRDDVDSVQIMDGIYESLRAEGIEVAGKETADAK